MVNKKALQICIEGTKEQRRYLCERDFSLFFTYYFLEYIKYPFAPFHFDMFADVKDLMEGKIREVAWIAFRESAKTSISKIFLMWMVAYGKKKYINVDSFDKENAERILFDIVLEMQINKRLRQDFGELYNSKRSSDEVKQKRINNFVTNNGVRVEAHSTQESVRGRIHGHQRPDFLLLDDFETAKTKDSEAYTSQIIKHIKEFQAGLDGSAKILYLGNYITEFGSVQSLINRSQHDKGLRIRIIPVIAGGLPTWPAKYALTDDEARGTGKISLEDKRRQLGSTDFNAEMMNQPIDEEKQEFKKELFVTVEWEDVQKKRTRNFITIDTAVSQRDEGDFTGITRNYVDDQNKWHLRAYRLKINPKELIDLLFVLYEQDRPEKIGIEKTIYLQALKGFIDDECRARNKFLPIVELDHNQVNKHSRIRGLQPRYESKSVFHIKNECMDLEEELLRFPRAVHDDVMDSAAYQLQIAQPPAGAEEQYKINVRRRERQNHELL